MKIVFTVLFDGFLHHGLGFPMETDSISLIVEWHSKFSNIVIIVSSEYGIFKMLWYFKNVDS